jgi:hypothetical protein
MRRLALGLALAGSWAGMAEAAGNRGPDDWREVRVMLSPDSGCWSYLGDVTVFTGRFKEGAYLGIQMVTIGPDGFPEPFDEDERVPGLEVPLVAGGLGVPSWFGPLPATKDYSFTFYPRSSFGSTALVTICGRISPPE